MTQDELQKRLVENGLEKRWLEILRLCKPTVRLHPRSVPDESIAIGRSKIGGSPDLPLEVAWPTEEIVTTETQTSFLFFKKTKEIHSKKPLAFLAQIELSEASKQDEEQVLPKSGILYFFYVADQTAWGFDPKDKNKFAVIYADVKPEALLRRPVPADLDEVEPFATCELTFRAELSLPAPYSDSLEALLLEEERELYESKVYDEGNLHKLLGNADEIQGEMQWECALVTNGINVGGANAYNSSAAQALKLQASDWRLLFQLDSEDAAHMMWGDCGRLYFWIRSEDLTARNFDQTWLILQCY